MTYKSLKELFIAICDAIRYKESSTGDINHQDIPARIRALITSATSILQRDKKFKPSETEYTGYSDDGYDGLSSVIIEAIPATYIGSAVVKKEASEYIPGTSDITIDENQYLIGAQTIKGDTDLISENIKSGVTIFDVAGSYAGEDVILQDKTVVPSNGVQFVTPDAGYNGLYQVTVSGDDDLKPENIKSGVTIFNVVGNYIAKVFNLESTKSVTPTKSAQRIVPENGFDGFEEVIVEPIPNNYVDTSTGNAEALHILNGKKAWVDGVEITGTHICEEGVDTSDATATPDDIVAGVTAYVNGEKIEGTLTSKMGETIEHATYSFLTKNSSNYVSNIRPFTEKTIVDANTHINGIISKSFFGDAAPEDVAAGKTFTSTSGVRITGTGTLGGGSSSGGYSSGDVVKAYPTSHTFVSGYVSGNITISYANAVGVDSDGEGKVELRGDDTSGISSGLTVSSTASCDPIKGKYITVKSGSTTSDVFYIPEDATFTYSNQSSRTTFSVDKCNKMFVLA